MRGVRVGTIVDVESFGGLPVDPIEIATHGPYVVLTVDTDGTCSRLTHGQALSLAQMLTQAAVEARASLLDRPPLEIAAETLRDEVSTWLKGQKS